MIARALSCIAIGFLVGQPLMTAAQEPDGSWLDAAKPVSWNEAGATVPAAPPVDEDINPRCAERVRPAELPEDRQLHERGWRLEGPYEGGWGVVVIHGTATYDGMCRPWQYQAFVFVRGVFAGTLSPAPMNSRTDGALQRVWLMGDGQLTAEYSRYAADDPACCPTSTTLVTFEIAEDGPVVRPLSAVTSRND